MDYPVSSFQYLALLTIAGFVAFGVARYLNWDLNDELVIAASVGLTIVVFSGLLFVLQYVRARYSLD